MGLFFHKKRMPEPFPPGDLRALRFPVTPPPERIIEPEKVKEAAGVRRTMPVMPLSRKPQPIPKEEPEMPMPPEMEPMGNEPLYVKVDVYQHLLGEMEELKEDLKNLGSASAALEKSELNEESRFADLKKNVRAIHDRLVEVDGLLFKA